MNREVYRDCCDTDILLPNDKVPCCYLYDRPGSVSFTAGWSAQCELYCPTMPRPASGTLTFSPGSSCAPLYTSVNVPFYFAFKYQLELPPATGACLTLGNSGTSVAPISSVCNLPDDSGAGQGFTASFSLTFPSCVGATGICTATIVITST